MMKEDIDKLKEYKRVLEEGVATYGYLRDNKMQHGICCFSELRLSEESQLKIRGVLIGEISSYEYICITPTENTDNGWSLFFNQGPRIRLLDKIIKELETSNNIPWWKRVLIWIQDN